MNLTKPQKETLIDFMCDYMNDVDWDEILPGDSKRVLSSLEAKGLIETKEGCLRFTSQGMDLASKLWVERFGEEDQDEDQV